MGLSSACRAGGHCGGEGGLEGFLRVLGQCAQQHLLFGHLHLATDDQAADAVQSELPPALPVVIERPAPGIEIELRGGRRVRFDRETDPETIRSLVSLLEAGAS